MSDSSPYIGWEAPEHRHIEKNDDWYWVLGIIATAFSVVCILYDNVLFGMVILLGAVTMMLVSHRAPRSILFEITNRGIRIGDRVYLFNELESFGIDISTPDDPQLVVKSRHLFMPFLVIPIPIDFVDDIDWIMNTRLPNEGHTEPFAHKILEFFGF
jgi:hypothetical protein